MTAFPAFVGHYSREGALARELVELSEAAE
jgi:hypothetical protein